MKDATELANQLQNLGMPADLAQHEATKALNDHQEGTTTTWTSPNGHVTLR